MRWRSIGVAVAAVVLGSTGASLAQAPFHPAALPGGGFALPNGWKITPAGAKVADTGDLIMNMSLAPDGRALVSLHGGYLPHGLTVVDPATHKTVQEIPLKSAWLGLSWAADGKTLFVSGGNANGNQRTATKAPIYVFPYAGAHLDADHMTQLEDPDIPLDKIYWGGVARHPTRSVLYAANRGVGADNSQVMVFDTNGGRALDRIGVGASPYDLVLSRDAKRLFVSNWSSRNVSVIDTVTNKVIATVEVGANPNDMVLAADGRLFVACSNDNTVRVIDTKTLAMTETIVTSLTSKALEGSTPNALELDPVRKLLFVANADNNDVAVVDIKDRAHSAVAGFIPTGWYPSALALAEKGQALYIGDSKGFAAYADPEGPHSPVRPDGSPGVSIKTLQTAAIERVTLADLKPKLAGYTKKVLANTPYNDTQLERAKPSPTASIVPSKVGQGSPIKHVIYIIKENRTYDQVLGDLAGTNGDPRLAIFGRQVTPNHHALAEQFVALDNVYCDGEVSEDGHSWSNAAYATDFNEKSWPASYGDHSDNGWAAAKVPNAGYLWDVAKRFNLTYRSYGEFAGRVSTGAKMEARQGIYGLLGHVNGDYKNFGARDSENADVFIKEFDAFEARFDSKDPNERLPNIIIMGLPEDHTKGTSPGEPTPQAAVASNDAALGRIVDRITHSRYWPETAIFVIEDDAQDGPDHVDARRTPAFVISPYIKRQTVDSTAYTTSSLLRTIELLLGLPPMSQFDAAAQPMYAAFGTTADLTPYKALPPSIDINAKNTRLAYGAQESAKMDFTEEDRVPMHRLNEIIWKSVYGADSAAPAPVHRYRALVQVP